MPMEASRGLCQAELPAMRELRDGHFIRCHLERPALAEMEPVFTQAPLRNAGKGDEFLGRAD
jgi:hypothetical protein